MSDNPIDKWSTELRRRQRQARRRRTEIERSIEAGIQRVVAAADRTDRRTRKRVSEQLERLSEIAGSEEADINTLSHVDREIRMMDREIRSSMDYDEAVEEADDIYGDQSENDTYYNLDRQSSRKPMDYDEAVEEADETYGDQSDNETYYRLDRSDRESFEDDGEWIDEEDRLDL